MCDGPKDKWAVAQWELVIYDEVHLLPAPVFHMTAAIQARRRLGLTATLLPGQGGDPIKPASATMHERTPT